MVICLEQDADLHMSQLMPLPLTVSCFSKIQIGFTFLVPAHPGSPGKRAIKRVCVLCVMKLNAEFDCCVCRDGSCRYLASSSKVQLFLNMCSLPRDTMLAWYMLWPCVCRCLCLSQVSVLLKWLNTGSHKQNRMIAQDFDRGHPLRGHQMQAGWVKIGDFRQIAGCMSKTVQCTISIKVK